MFFCNVAAIIEIYTYVHTLYLHDALPIYSARFLSHPLVLKILAIAFAVAAPASDLFADAAIRNPPDPFQLILEFLNMSLRSLTHPHVSCSPASHSGDGCGVPWWRQERKSDV